jgi:hypothetical protein
MLCLAHKISDRLGNCELIFCFIFGLNFAPVTTGMAFQVRAGVNVAGFKVLKDSPCGDDFPERKAWCDLALVFRTP